MGDVWEREIPAVAQVDDSHWVYSDAVAGSNALEVANQYPVGLLSRVDGEDVREACMHALRDGYATLGKEAVDVLDDLGAVFILSITSCDDEDGGDERASI